MSVSSHFKMMVRSRLSKLFVALSSILPVFSSAQTSQKPTARVPYVGCAADGQVGEQPAPKGQAKATDLPAAAAAQLAWYEYKGEVGEIGTLAPRGWNCFVTYGSNGTTLYVAPEPLDAAKLILRKNWKGFTGAAIQLSSTVGDTSGRFEVARVVARVFPAHRAYARRVIHEDHEAAKDYPFGPFSADELTYRSRELVEFVTPSHTDGLGTMSWLLPSEQPIYGMVSLAPTEDYDLFQLSVRLPASLSSLAPILVRQAEPHTTASR